MRVTIIDPSGSSTEFEDVYPVIDSHGDLAIADLDDNILSEHDAGTWVHVTVSAK